MCCDSVYADFLDTKKPPETLVAKYGKSLPRNSETGFVELEVGLDLVGGQCACVDADGGNGTGEGQRPRIVPFALE